MRVPGLQSLPVGAGLGKKPQRRTQAIPAFGAHRPNEQDGDQEQGAQRSHAQNQRGERTPIDALLVQLLEQQGTLGGLLGRETSPHPQRPAFAGQPIGSDQHPFGIGGIDDPVESGARRGRGGPDVHHIALEEHLFGAELFLVRLEIGDPGLRRCG